MRYVLAGLLAIGFAGPAAATEINRETGDDGIVRDGRNDPSGAC